MTPDNEQYNGDDDTYYMNGPDEFVKGEPEKKIKMTFGLQPSHIEAIEKRMSAFPDAVYSTGMWEWVAKDVGWCPLTLALYYFRHLKETESMEQENTRLRKLIEKAFDAGRKSDYEPYDESWEQFKKDNDVQ